MSKSKIAVLASGQGTTAEAFIRAAAAGEVEPQVGLVICNKKDAGVFERIAKLNKELDLKIETVLINGSTHPDTAIEPVPGAQTAAEEEAIIDKLLEGKFDLVMLMGYMKKIGPKLVREFGWRPEYQRPYQAMMLNTHPGLLPATKGLIGIHVQEFVLENKLPYGGQTLHVVSEKYDEGPTIAEHKVEVLPGDTPKSLFERVQLIEKTQLPKDVEEFIKKRRQYLSDNL